MIRFASDKVNIEDDLTEDKITEVTENITIIVKVRWKWTGFFVRLNDERWIDKPLE